MCVRWAVWGGEGGCVCALGCVVGGVRWVVCLGCGLWGRGAETKKWERGGGGRLGWDVERHLMSRPLKKMVILREFEGVSEELREFEAGMKRWRLKTS